MNKSLLAQEEPQNGYFPLKKLFKTIPTNLIYNICRFGIDDEERKGVKDVLEVLDPDDGDERLEDWIYLSLKHKLYF